MELDGEDNAAAPLQHANVTTESKLKRLQKFRELFLALQKAPNEEKLKELEYLKNDFMEKTYGEQDEQVKNAIETILVQNNKKDGQHIIMFGRVVG